MTSLAEHYGHCESHIRVADHDAWIATLFAPAAKRPHLCALQAFFLEIAQVRERVKESLAGELRLQWWRDAVQGDARGDVEAHPFAAALLDTIKTFRLPRDILTEAIEAHRFDVYDDTMPSLHDWESYVDGTEAARIRLASTILTGKLEPGGIAAASHAGAALSVMRQLVEIGREPRPVFIPADLLARHKLVPHDIEAARMTPAVAEVLADMRGIARLHLDALKRQAGGVDPAALPAYLTASVVEPTLRNGERKGADPFKTSPAGPRGGGQWVLGGARRRGFPAGQAA